MSKTEKSLLNQWLLANQEENKPKVNPSKNNLLSSGEKRLYFLQSLHPDNPSYHYVEVYDLTGHWNINYIKNSLESVAYNNPIFSENFIQTDDGNVEIQTIDRNVLTQRVIYSEEYQSIDNSQLEEIKNKFVTKPFELSSDPLFRYLLIEKGDSDIELVVVLHHIITDAWSMIEFRNQFKQYYQDYSRGKKVINNSYSNHLRTIRSTASNKAPDEQGLEYWVNKLKGIKQKTILPFKKNGEGQLSKKGALLTRVIDNSLKLKINEFVKENNVTNFTTFLTIYKILLAKYNNDETVLVGTPVSNRDDIELESAIGFFIETIVLKTNISKSESFKEVLKKVENEILDSFDYKNIPFQNIVHAIGEQRDAYDTSFFSTMFIYQTQESDMDFGENRRMKISNLDIGYSKFDFTLFVEQLTNHDYKLLVEYATDKLSNNAVEVIIDHYVTLTELLLSNPHIPISELLLGKQSALGHTNDIILNHTVVDQILEQALLKPDSIAVSTVEEKVTYGQLVKKSSRLANELSKYNTSVVGLYLNRSVDMIVGILGVMQAGFQYMPIDPEYPEERVQHMLEDSGCKVVITNENLQGSLKNVLISQVSLNSITDNDEIINLSDPNSYAYLIYTSGSSGKPKGINITHKNLWYSNLARESFYPTNPTSFLLLSSFSFDSSVAGIFWTLTSGGKLVISKEREEQDIQHLIQKINMEKVSHTLLLPSLYEYILEFSVGNQLDSLECVIVAGEACRKSVVFQHFNIHPKASLYNEYGPTEVSVWSVAHQIQESDVNRERIPIGLPIPNVIASIMDPRGQKVPIGIPGELYLSGPLVSNGYHNQPIKTAEQFVVVDHTPMYKTGDLVLLNEDGVIDFLGRVDDQIKIRGHRVEVEEINSRIKELSSIQEVHTVFDSNKEQLITFLTSSMYQDELSIKHSLRDILPSYMVPNRILQLQEIPYLPNGKVDQKQLLVIAEGVVSEIESEKPVNEIEAKLLMIWNEVLGIDNIGVLDNFFSIGGDSLLSIRVNAKARNSGINFSTNKMFELQTIRELSNYIIHNEEQLTEKVFEQVQISPIQNWFFETHHSHPNYWHQIYEITFTRAIDHSILQQALQSLINNHQSLRSSFTENNQLQLFNKSYQFKLLESKSINVDTQLVAEQINIYKNNLFQALTTTENNKSILRIIVHHLVFDALSFQTFVDQLLVLLNKEISSSKVPELTTTQYSTYVNELYSLNGFEEEINFWEQQIVHEPIKPTTEAKIIQHQLVLSKTDTQQLIDANQPFNTTIDDLLLTAYLLSIQQVTNQEEIAVGMENHGRANQHSQLNLSQSIGWFTAFYPRKFILKNDQLVDIIKWVKDESRKTPNSGIGFGLLGNQQLDFDHKTCFPYVFNFLGQFGDNKNALIEKIEFIQEFSRHQDAEVYHKIELNTIIKDDQLDCTFRFNENHIIDSTVFISKFRTYLKEIVLICLNSDQSKTSSDFDVDGLNQDDLDELMKNFEL